MRRLRSGSGRGRGMDMARSTYPTFPKSTPGAGVPWWRGRWPAMREANRRAAVPFILITVLLDTLGVGLIIPVGPRLVASFLHDDLGAASHYFCLLRSLYS